MLGLVEIVI